MSVLNSLIEKYGVVLHLAICFACDVADNKNVALFCIVNQDGSLHEMHRHELTGDNDDGWIATKIDVVLKLNLQFLVVMPNSKVACCAGLDWDTCPTTPAQIEDAQAR